MRVKTERERERGRAAARARHLALRDLSHQFPAEYRVLYEKYAVEEGILPNGMREQLIHEAQRQVAAN